MDGLSLHLPPVIPDSYYDISNHGSAYQPFQAPSSWMTRDESSRGYHPAQTNDYDTNLRFPGNSDRQECTIVGSEEALDPSGNEERAEETRETGTFVILIRQIIPLLVEMIRSDFAQGCNY